MEEIEEGEYVYETIVDHRFENGSLKLKVKYYNRINGKDNVVEMGGNPQCMGYKGPNRKCKSNKAATSNQGGR
eukprot:7331152-Ditylum_brightwellii.AAC.1